MTCAEKVLVGFDGSIARDQLLDISLKGALVDGDPTISVPMQHPVHNV
jgi:hypothetical protein